MHPRKIKAHNNYARKIKDKDKPEEVKQSVKVRKFEDPCKRCHETTCADCPATF
jgi:hypothetical protein